MKTNPNQAHTHRIIMRHQDDILPPHPESYGEWEPGQPPGGIPLRRRKPEEKSAPEKVPNPKLPTQESPPC